MGASIALNLGFLTVLREANGYVGGYLVTNIWGRPLEFRLSTAVQPNRVQQILYGETLEPYIYADLIGKTLVDKTGTAAQMIVTDRPAALELRRSLNVPVAWIAPSAADDPDANLIPGVEAWARDGSKAPVFVHTLFWEDVIPVRETLARLDGLVDLVEPFL